ncbi:MAG: hypothetical protein NVSMB9_09190 [Isosphaeraceae bacterium]
MDIRQEFAKAPAGGMTRQRILEMLQRLSEVRRLVGCTLC